MDAWGPGSYENEEALDLVSELLDSPKANALLEETLRGALAPTADLRATARGVAAADIAAAGRGRPGLGVPEDVRELLALYLVYPTDEMLALGVEAIDAARAASSPLRAFWQTRGDLAQWDEIVGLLQARLGELSSR